MGRKRKTQKHLPSRVYLNRKTYFYVQPDGKWIRLGKSEAEMYRALAALVDDDLKPGAMSEVLGRYEREVLPTKSPGTIISQTTQLARLKRVFGATQPSDIKSVHIGQYLDQHDHAVMANREISLLSHVFKKCVRWGLIETNPCSGVERHSEKPRDRYVTDDEYAAVHAAADLHLQILMELALCTGQRQSDLLTIKPRQLMEDGIHFHPAKTKRSTGKKLIVRWSPRLTEAVEAARSLPPSGVLHTWLLHRPDGDRYQSFTIQKHWRKLIKKCIDAGTLKEPFQFRDLRAKARTDGDDPKLLGHANPAAMDKVYNRKPDTVEPAK